MRCTVFMNHLLIFIEPLLTLYCLRHSLHSQFWNFEICCQSISPLVWWATWLICRLYLYLYVAIGVSGVVCRNLLSVLTKSYQSPPGLISSFWLGPPFLSGKTWGSCVIATTPGDSNPFSTPFDFNFFSFFPLFSLSWMSSCFCKLSMAFSSLAALSLSSIFKNLLFCYK